MPCWYYEKKDLRVTPSLQDGINPDVEARYRREGARFIMDTGTKMGLRYDTCSTGVVYFHRFYMFHSFREFHRYVTAACCLFLAGKVEETPKKCKDIIKITRNMLTEAQFAVFGDDPREEVMTMERILLQTIKFDLMVEHPYAYLMKLAKMVKGDKDKTQKLVQMAWTFVNDSMCTMLCLQWEPDIIAVALMYLASRLTKVEVTDWHGKVPGQKIKWYEALVEDATLEILEDVCHQVLDLYSTTPQATREDSPPPPPPPPPKQVTSSPVPAKTPTKRSRSPSPVKGSKSSKKNSPAPRQRSITPTVDEKLSVKPVAAATTTSAAINQPPSTTYSQTNPYLSSQMYSSSFMSGEGSNAIQTLIGGQAVPTPVTAAQGTAYAVSSQYSAAQQPGARNPTSYASSAYTQQTATYSYQQQQQSQAAVPSASYTQTQYSQQQQAGSHQQQSYSQYQSYPAPPQQQAPPPQQSYTYPPPPSSAQPSQQYGSSYSQPPPGYSQHSYNQYAGSRAPPSRGQPAVRLTSKPPIRMTNRMPPRR